MQSPFAVFRKYQKTGMVILVGMSMIGFVLLGAVNDPTNIPKPLIFISIIAVVAGAAWVLGMRSKKSAEYGSWGVVLGAAIAFFITMSGGPPAALKSDSGDLTAVQLQDLRNRRRLANDFIGQVLVETRDQREVNFLAQQYQFGFGFDGSILSDRDVVTSELLRREADKLGLDVTTESVYAYLKQISDNKLTSDKFKEIRMRLKLSESDVQSILSDELQTRLAAEYLYDYEFDDMFRYSPTLTPEEYWEFYQRMYVSQKAEVAAIPVKDFVDETQEPSPNELATFFEEYRHNFPNVTAKGELEEGRPGFQQPRRVQLAYLEAVFDDFREGIAPVTEEEIRQRYEEQYVKPAEEAAARAAEQAEKEKEQGGPALRDQPGTSTEPADGATPESSAPDGAGAETPTPSGTPEPGTSDSATPEPTTPESGTPEPATPNDSPESAAPPEGETSPQAGVIPSASQLQTVALLQEPAAAESESASSAQDTPADAGGSSEQAGDVPARSDDAEQSEGTEPAVTPAEGETPPAESATTPAADPATPAEGNEPSGPTATETPAAETPAESTPATGDQPPAPSTTVPLLDEGLKAQIRVDLENERITDRLSQVADEAANFVDDVALLMNAPEEDPSRITVEEGTKRFKKYAEEHHLTYAETPYLSAEELSKSEDHPVGQAISGEGQNQQLITNAIFQTSAQDTYRPITARSPVTDSWFVAWKTGDRDAFVPEDMSDERVREQVVAAWREFQARDKAKARAEDLAQLVNDTGKPMGELFGEQTVTGKGGADAIPIAETGEFRWLSIPGAQQPNPFSYYPPEIQDPPGVEKAGPDFMKTVFDSIAPGQTGVAPNFDRSIFYVVHVTGRTPVPSDTTAFDDFRKRFLYEPVFEQNDFLAQFGLDPRSLYQRLAVRTMVEYQSDWVDELWKRHNAQLYEPEKKAS